MEGPTYRFLVPPEVRRIAARCSRHTHDQDVTRSLGTWQAGVRGRRDETEAPNSACGPGPAIYIYAHIPPKNKKGF
jgi:hypothetical protein